MARERRVLRLQQLILEVAAEALQREVSDPRLDMVTLTRVKLSPDLAQATLGWSCLAKEKGRAKTEEALERALPLLQRRVGQEIQIRTTPRLVLRYDPALERAQRLDDLFHALAEERAEHVPDTPDEAEAGDDVDEADAADTADDSDDAARRA